MEKAFYIKKMEIKNMKDILKMDIMKVLEQNIFLMEKEKENEIL